MESLTRFSEFLGAKRRKIFRGVLEVKIPDLEGFIHEMPNEIFEIFRREAPESFLGVFGGGNPGF